MYAADQICGYEHVVSLMFSPRIPRNALLHAALNIIIIIIIIIIVIDLSCALCCQAPRLWALTYVSAGGLVCGIFKLAYKAGNMVK